MSTKVTASVLDWRPGFVSMEHNEFKTLFSTKEEAVEKREKTKIIYQNNVITIDRLIQDIVLVTLDPESKTTKAFLPNVSENVPGQTWISLSILPNVLTERLRLRRVRRVGPSEQHVIVEVMEPKPLVYIYHCYRRCCEYIGGERDQTKLLILNSIRGQLLIQSQKVLNNPKTISDDLYSTETIRDQIIKLVESGNHLSQFLEECLTLGPASVLSEVFGKIRDKIDSLTLSNIITGTDLLTFVSELCTGERTGKELLLASRPIQSKSGREWEKTLLGSLLNISVGPRIGRRPEFFVNSMLISDYKVNETNAFSNTEVHFNWTFLIWENLLKSGSGNRELALSWVADCLKANQGRRGEMAEHGSTSHLFSSTPFFVNLSRIMVQFCVKALRKHSHEKLMSVLPDYFSRRNIMVGYNVEASLVPETGDHCQLNGDHKMLSDFFFMSHCCLNLGFNQAHKEIRKIEKDIGEIAVCEKKLKTIEDLKGKVLLNLKYPKPVRVLIRNEKELKSLKEQTYMIHACLRTAVMNRPMRENLNIFINHSTSWLLKQCEVELDDFRLIKTDSLPETPPSQLGLVPEFIFENIYNFLNLENTPPVYGRKEKVFSDSIQSNVVSLLTVFMSTTWVKNPYMRAKFGSALSLLLPAVGREDLYRSASLLQPQCDSPLLQPATVAEADSLFGDITYKRELVVAIYNVFVTLEVTGDSMQFESKFNARYPLNSVLFYLLKIDDFRDVIEIIATEAHNDMANQQPPVFLRFVNALINDSNWLLDESLIHMKKIREIENIVDSLTWGNMPDSDKEQKLAELKQSQDMVKWLNNLSSDHVRMLEALSKLTNCVFTHVDMADRIAAMLNNFLSTLTGDDKNSYRTKDLDSLHFRPKDLVMSLVRIYCQLSTSQTFILAVSQDERYYSPNLFKMAGTILSKIGQPQDVEDLDRVASKVKVMSENQGEEVDLTSEAPDEFLDPISCTLMREPVRLPSSRKIVDRKTIAKHLLSDEKDPFNREPLTLDKVIPELEMKSEIEDWIKSRTNPSLDTSANLTSSKTDEEVPINISTTFQCSAAPEVCSETFSTILEAEQHIARVHRTQYTSSTCKDNLSRTAESSSFSGGHSLGGNKLLPRIKKDLAEINREKTDGIFVVPDEQDMTRLHVVVTGPSDTPYAGGYFYFVLECPSNYPTSPPRAKLITTDGGRVRFNPNLYKNGKVCLSILGTWEGPGWSPAISLLQVILSIQSLMNEKPFYNEPGLEETGPHDPRSTSYNEIIQHETVRVGFLGMLNHPPDGLPKDIHDEIKSVALLQVRNHLAVIEKMKHMDGKQMRDPMGENKGIFAWDKMKQQLLTLK